MFAATNNYLIYFNYVIKKNSQELRTRILSSKSGSFLPQKIIELVQNFYELGVTSVTNIPMKVSHCVAKVNHKKNINEFMKLLFNQEELNANSSANYDVDILHSKELHDQLKICGLYKNCVLKKDAPNTVCLKWSNPKTNITGKRLTITVTYIIVSHIALILVHLKK